ncbi:MAG: TIGR03085 family metal-binding protein [Actinomycetota bacterium]
MTRYAAAERAELCDTLLRLGPQGATLCQGWTTRDLAEHLVLRDQRPDVLAGSALPAAVVNSALLGRLDITRRISAIQDKIASTSWADLIAQLRAGPPSWNPTRLSAVNETVNAAEFFIHHEDVLRATEGWTTPREIATDTSRILWRSSQVLGRIALRHSLIGVEIVVPELGRAIVKRRSLLVRVTGTAPEVLLYVAGRRAVAQVALDGSPEAIHALANTTGTI